MNYYYILESGELTESKWEKRPGDVHRNSRVKLVITKQMYDELNAELVRRQNAERNASYRRSKKETDLWLAKIIIEAGSSAGITPGDTIQVMSLKALKSELK